MEDLQREEEQIVDSFCQSMLEKIQLRHNRYAPLGWKTMDIKRLLTLLKGELAELEESYKENDFQNVSREAIDVANYAMFISELSRNQ